MDTVNYLKFVLALVFVISLAYVAGWALKRLKLGNGGFAQPKDKRRLHLVESIAIDGANRASIVRHNDTEHLIITGPNNQTVVNSQDSKTKATSAELYEVPKSQEKL